MNSTVYVVEWTRGGIQSSRTFVAGYEAYGFLSWLIRGVDRCATINLVNKELAQ